MTAILLLVTIVTVLLVTMILLLVTLLTVQYKAKPFGVCSPNRAAGVLTIDLPSQAETRAEFSERSIVKLEKTIDGLEGKSSYSA